MPCYQRVAGEQDSFRGQQVGGVAAGVARGRHLDDPAGQPCQGRGVHSGCRGDFQIEVAVDCPQGVSDPAAAAVGGELPEHPGRAYLLHVLASGVIDLFAAGVDLHADPCEKGGNGADVVEVAWVMSTAATSLS